MDLISKTDALDKVHKTIENLILRLPTVRGVDGEDYCTDPASLAAYNIAYGNIRREIEGIQAWHTEDPEEQREYIVTLSEKWLDGKTYKFLAILEWVPPLTNDEGDIIEDGEWCFEPWMRESCKDLNVLAWMPLPDKYEGEV